MASAKKENRKQLEGLTVGEAQDVIDEIDTLDGNPKKGVFGAGAQHLEAACDAWLASDMSTPPPPGITQTWAIPEEHPSQPGNHAVPLRPHHQDHIDGMDINGKTYGQEHMKDRDPEWNPGDGNPNP